MGTPSAKRISAKLSSAPARNSLNILGGGGQGAASPIKLKVSESLIGSMASGKSGTPAKPSGSPTYKRMKKASFGDPSQILNSPTKGVKSSFADKLPGSKGSVGFPGNGVD